MLFKVDRIPPEAVANLAVAESGQPCHRCCTTVVAGHELNCVFVCHTQPRSRLKPHFSKLPFSEVCLSPLTAIACEPLYTHRFAVQATV